MTAGPVESVIVVLILGALVAAYVAAWAWFDR